MPIVVARTKVKGKNFEISVDFDEAMKVKQGTGDITRALNSNTIYTDVKKGNAAPNSELSVAFGTTELYGIAMQIIKSGEVQKPQEARDAEREMRVKRLIDLVVRNAVDQHGRPYTFDRIQKGMHEIHYNVDNRPAEQQLGEFLEKLKTILPIKVETKHIRLTIPARFSGQVYGLLKDHKESEEWLANGDLQVVMNLPAGMQLDFYDKLNSVTHGAIVSEEIK
ncbi:MAG: ribosome assembly factor SBDS [Nanoarchaeota archaeon]